MSENKTRRHWPWRIARGAIAGSACLAAMQGVTPETGWFEFVTLIKPATFFPLLVAFGTSVVPHDVLRRGKVGQ